MNVAATTSPTPGWYPDPRDTSSLRWWDGSAWTDFTSPALPPEPEAEPSAPFEPAFTATTSEPVAFVEPALVFDQETVEPELEPEPAAEIEPPLVFDAPAPAPIGEAFSFRARPLLPDPEPVCLEPEQPDEIPVYMSPLATIASPLPARVAAPEPVATGLAPPATAEPEAAPKPVAYVTAEPEVAEPPAEEPEKRSRRGRKKAPGTVSIPIEPVRTPAVEEPEPAVRGPKRSRRPGRKTAVGTAAVVVAAAGAASATNLITGDGRVAGESHAAASGKPALSAVDNVCLQEWNTSIGGDAAQQRVTLGQFSGAYAHVARVAPLRGTLMDPESCGLTVYDPSADTHAVFVSGVKDHVGYMDVTAYPRAARQYGWPKSQTQANVIIQDDGSLRVRRY